MIDLPNQKYFKIRTIAAYFGVNPKTITNWVQGGHLDSIKIGGTILITRESVIKYQTSYPKDI